MKQPGRIARLAGVATLLLLSASTVAAEVTNRIVARVNDKIATLWDYQDRYQEAVARAAADVPTDPALRETFLADKAREVMKLMFEELLILSRADQLGIFVSDAEVEEQLARMRKDTGLEDDDQFRVALGQAGLTLDALRSQYRRQLTFQRVVGREVYSKIDIEDEDVRRYYRENEERFRLPERVELQEVVVLDDSDSSEAEALAQRLVAEIRAGRSLEEVREGLDDETVSSLIDLGWVERGDLDATLEAAVWDLEVGSVSDPTRARGGLHIVRMVDREESTVRPFSEVEDQIRAQLQRERTEENLDSYLVDLEHKAYIRLDPPPAAAGFRSATGETPLSADFTVLEKQPEESKKK